MDDDVRRDEGEPPVAQPGVWPAEPDSGDEPTLVLDVDGERFAVRVTELPSGAATTDYTWLSGPNKGYGFGSTGPANPSPADHRESIRGFLSMVNPATGYIEDE
jgi:hypothetical protein